jgi:hypothetical protein
VDAKPLMATVRSLSRSFSLRVRSRPELFGRIDLQKRQEGLARCRNFITLPHGPAFNRPGTEFVREVKTSASATRIIPFSYNNAQTFVIEMGAGYFRWHTDAATLTYTTAAPTWRRPPSPPRGHRPYQLDSARPSHRLAGEFRLLGHCAPAAGVGHGVLRRCAGGQLLQGRGHGRGRSD